MSPAESLSSVTPAGVRGQVVGVPTSRVRSMSSVLPYVAGEGDHEVVEGARRAHHRFG
jgi:hypothetical protein